MLLCHTGSGAAARPHHFEAEPEQAKAKAGGAGCGGGSDSLAPGQAGLQENKRKGPPANLNNPFMRKAKAPKA